MLVYPGAHSVSMTIHSLKLLHLDCLLLRGHLFFSWWLECDLGRDRDTHLSRLSGFLLNIFLISSLWCTLLSWVFIGWPIYNFLYAYILLINKVSMYRATLDTPIYKQRRLELYQRKLFLNCFSQALFMMHRFLCWPMKLPRTLLIIHGVFLTEPFILLFRIKVFIHGYAYLVRRWRLVERVVGDYVFEVLLALRVLLWETLVATVRVIWVRYCLEFWVSAPTEILQGLCVRLLWFYVNMFFGSLAL